MIADLKDQRKECQNPGSKGQQNVNKTKETTTNDMEAQPAQPPNTKKPTEFAGRASRNQLTPSPTNADHNWNADTWASAHMTPCQDWLCNYQLRHIPKKLADNTIVYSEGVGSVLSIPESTAEKLDLWKYLKCFTCPNYKIIYYPYFALLRKHDYSYDTIFTPIPNF